MIRYLLIFLLFGATATQAAISRVQSVTASTGATTANNIPISISAPTVGNVIVVAVCTANTQGVQMDASFLSGGFNDIWEPNNAIHLVLGVFVVTGTPGTTITVRTVNAASIAMSAVAIEYTGFNLRPDTTDGIGVTGNSASPASGTLATNFANEVMVVAIGERGTFSSAQTGWVTSPTNSFTTGTTLQTSTNINTTNNDRAIAVLERITTATVSTTGGGTITSTRWCAKGLTLREVPGAGFTGGD